MTRIRKNFVVAATLCATLVWGANEYSIRAQSSYGAPTVKIAPEAQAQLDKTKAAYKALAFYASEIKLESTGLPDNLQLMGKIAWKKPNSFRVESDNGAGPSLYVSDGARLYITIARAPKQYLEKTVSSSRSSLPAVLGETGVDKTTLGAFLMGKDPLRQFGSALQSVELKKVKAGDQVATDRVALVMKLVRRKDEGTATFLIDKKTNLLRSVKIVRPVNGVPPSVSEIYNGRRVKESGEENFEYSPPPGYLRVNKFETLPYDPRLVPGAQPFRLDVKDIDGKMLNLDQHKGKVVVLDFWATWCPPCKDDAPRLASLYHANKSYGLEVIGVNMDYDMQNLRPFAAHYKMSWPQYYDGKGWNNLLARRFGVRSIPFTLVIGRDGKIVSSLGNNAGEREQWVRSALMQKAE